MRNSRFALRGLASPQFTVCALSLAPFHGLCAFFRLVLTPVSTAPFWPTSQFTVCTSSRFTRPRRIFRVAMPEVRCDFLGEIWNLKLPIFPGKNLVKFVGKTFLPARQALGVSERISERISGKFPGTSFRISRPFAETSFSRRAVLKNFNKRLELYILQIFCKVVVLA